MADRPPVIAAWGPGVDSTAMVVELAERGEAVDMVLPANPGDEKSRTYAYIPVFQAWMAERASHPKWSVTSPAISSICHPIRGSPSTC